MSDSFGPGGVIVQSVKQLLELAGINPVAPAMTNRNDVNTITLDGVENPIGAAWPNVGSTSDAVFELLVLGCHGMALRESLERFHKGDESGVPLGGAVERPLNNPRICVANVLLGARMKEYCEPFHAPSSGVLAIPNS